MSKQNGLQEKKLKIDQQCSCPPISPKQLRRVAFLPCQDGLDTQILLAQPESEQTRLFQPNLFVIITSAPSSQNSKKNSLPLQKKHFVRRDDAVVKKDPGSKRGAVHLAAHLRWLISHPTVAFREPGKQIESPRRLKRVLKTILTVMEICCLVKMRAFSSLVSFCALSFPGRLHCKYVKFLTCVMLFAHGF